MDTNRPASVPLRWRGDESGVSMVLGGILLLAATIATGTVVFVLVSHQPAAPPATPTIWFDANDAERALTVMSAPSHLSWTDVDLSGCAAPRLVTDTGASAWVERSGPVHGGDRIFGCGSGEAVMMSYTPNNALLYGPHQFH